MVKTCLREDLEIGIIQDADKADQTIGTAASIYKVVKEYDDGRYDLLILGEKRFRIINTISDYAFPAGEIEYIFDENDLSVDDDRVEALLELYWGFISRLGLRKNQRQNLDTIVNQLTEEQEISYIIGQTIGMDSSRQRELLAEVLPESRLYTLTTELKRSKTVHTVARDLFENERFDPMLN